MGPNGRNTALDQIEHWIISLELMINVCDLNYVSGVRTPLRLPDSHWKMPSGTNLLPTPIAYQGIAAEE